MRVDALALAELTLRKNFAYWKSRWSPCVEPSPELAIAAAIPTAHTFPSEIWIGDTARYPYREIFFEDRALLSRNSRTDRGKIQKGDPVRTMEDAIECNLHHFVFAYLAVHDPYYAEQGRPEDVAPTQWPFGVFIPHTLDEFPRCNATRRDLASPDVKNGTEGLEAQFLMPDDARRYAEYECQNDERHKGDFWHYWGGYQYWRDPKYKEENPWTWRLEFHYLNSVLVEQVSAVLWPVGMVRLESGGWRPTLTDNKEVQRFRMEYPGISLVTYNWDPDDFSDSLIRASYSVMRYYLDKGLFPDTAEDAWRYLENAS